jgi:hypothetical protein
VILARAQTLVAAGALGVPAIDTPYPDHSDPAGLRREADAAAADGFAGKILIHPAQIDIVNAAFTPAADQVRWAERVNAAFTANPDSGVFALDGKMIDRPHWKLAQRILAAAGAGAAEEAAACRRSPDTRGLQDPGSDMIAPRSARHGKAGQERLRGGLAMAGDRIAADSAALR